ncbi:putative ribonuclease h protein, partial [Nicotiana attenuata]
MAGRTVLAKSTLNSIPRHVMQYIFLPTKVTKQIDKLQRNFIWGTTPEKRKMHLVKWEVVTQTKQEGGLGLQKACQKNKASLANLAWRAYKNTNCLWARVLIHKHCNMSRPNQGQRQRRTQKSPILKGLLKGWETCAKGSRWVVHKGNKVNFFNDKWIPNQPALRELIQGPQTQNDLNIKVNSVHQMGSWNTSSLSFSLPPHIHDLLRSVFIPSVSTKEDNLIRDLTANGQFSISSAYSLLSRQNQSTTTDGGELFKGLWKLHIPNKIKNFLWLLTHKRLPTRSFLHSIGLECPQQCHFCGFDKEDIDHIFSQCPNAVQFWHSIRAKASTSTMPSLSLNGLPWASIMSTIKDIKYNECLNRGNLMPFCLWHIWLTRNSNVFNNKRDPINANNTIAKATEFCVLSDSKHAKYKHQVMLKWSPPPRESYKLNRDGAAKRNPGIGGVFRNHNGEWILGYMENIPFTSNTGAEIRAITKGLQLAEQHNLLPLEINTDSAETINMLINGNMIFDPLICECRSLIQRMGRVEVKRTYKEQDRVADVLAKKA